MSDSATEMISSAYKIERILTNCSEAKEPVLPAAHVQRSLVQAEQFGEPLGDFRAHGQQFAVEMAPHLRLPFGG